MNIGEWEMKEYAWGPAGIWTHDFWILLWALFIQTLGFFHRYESLHPGNPEVAAEYKGKLYCFASDEKLDKFMR